MKCSLQPEIIGEHFLSVILIIYAVNAVRRFMGQEIEIQNVDGDCRLERTVILAGSEALSVQQSPVIERALLHVGFIDHLNFDVDPLA